jgi:hypothetical protein
LNKYDRQSTGFDWSTWFLWVFACTAGTVVGGLTSVALEVYVLKDMLEVAAAAISWAVFGAIVGMMQWLLLRLRTDRAGWWVLISALGLALCSPIRPFVLLSANPLDWVDFFITFGLVGSVTVGAIIGTVIGATQWLVLRKWLHRAGWWVLASVVGLAVCAAVFDIVGLSVFVTVGYFFGTITSVALVGGLVGVIFGAITGTVMVWLLQQPVATGA